MDPLDKHIQALPLELFNRIYDYVFTASPDTLEINKDYKSTHLLRVNTNSRHLYAESFYGFINSIFVFRNHAMVENWLKALDPAHRDLIQAVQYISPGGRNIFTQPVDITRSVVFGLYQHEIQLDWEGTLTGFEQCLERLRTLRTEMAEQDTQPTSAFRACPEVIRGDANRWPICDEAQCWSEETKSERAGTRKMDAVKEEVARREEAMEEQVRRERARREQARIEQARGKVAMDQSTMPTFAFRAYPQLMVHDVIGDDAGWQGGIIGRALCGAGRAV